MEWFDRLYLFTVLDAVGLGLLIVSWIGSTIIIENAPKSHRSTSEIMAGYRRDWMRTFVDRDPRIFDSQIIASLRQGTAFFASASMIAIGGGFALLGNAERLRGVAQDLTLESDPIFLLEVKLLVLLLFAANAFLKFVWSHRLFGYCSVIMAAVPDDPTDPQGLAHRLAGRRDQHHRGAGLQPGFAVGLFRDRLVRLASWRRALDTCQLGNAAGDPAPGVRVEIAACAAQWRAGCGNVILRVAGDLLPLDHDVSFLGRPPDFHRSCLCGPPEIVGSDISANRVSVTVSHPDTGWEHYADGWRIEADNGAVIATRELLHPHVNEQPFTRSLSVGDLPEAPLFIRAKCSVDGWSETRAPLPR